MPAALPVAVLAVEHVLAVRGRGGYRQYRIPALAVTSRGTVLAAYDGRPNLDDLPSPIDLLIRRSTDNGQTWGTAGGAEGPGLEGYGDPSLLVDAETGRIFLFHAAGTRAGFFEATGVAPGPPVQHTDLSWSDDDGVTWQHRRITAELKGSSAREITGIFAAAGQGIQIHAGPYRGRWCSSSLSCAGEESRRRRPTVTTTARAGRWGEIEAPPQGAAPNENKVAALGWQAAPAQPGNAPAAGRHLHGRRPQLEPAGACRGPSGSQRQRLTVPLRRTAVRHGLWRHGDGNRWLLATNNREHPRCAATPS